MRGREIGAQDGQDGTRIGEQQCDTHPIENEKE
jgi:hypothetical protein